MGSIQYEIGTGREEQWYRKSEREREYKTSEWDAKRKGVRQPTSASRRPNGRRRRK